MRFDILQSILSSFISAHLFSCLSPFRGGWRWREGAPPPSFASLSFPFFSSFSLHNQISTHEESNWGTEEEREEGRESSGKKKEA